MRMKMNYDKRLLSIDEASQYIGRSWLTTRKFCDAIGATRKFGTRLLFDKKIIDERIDELKGRGS